jgi:hypothetical protein
MSHISTLSAGGSFELSATYYAPYLTDAQVKTLEEHGIYAVQGKADSNRVIVELN